MFEFYLVRHGTTESNEKHKIMGQLDTPLTNHGIKDAEFLARKLKDIRFDAIYSSDLGRAFITEFIIASLDHEENLIHKSKALREINYGEFQNLPKEEVKAKHPEYKTDSSYVFPGGESFDNVQTRAIKFILSLEKKYPNRKILFVSHAGVIRCIKSHFLKKNLGKYLKSEVSHKYVGKFVLDKGVLLDYSEF